MKNCIIDSPTDICLEQESVPTGMSLAEHHFATEPMEMIHASWTRQSELAENRFATEFMPVAHPTHMQQSELAENRFATEFMPVVRPARVWQSEMEAEWHTSFEQAISERAARVSQQLRRLSTTDLNHAVPATDPLPVAPRVELVGLRRFWRERKRAIIFTCLGFSLFLLGFDLMGLLVALR